MLTLGQIKNLPVSLDVKEAAKLLGVCPHTIYAMIGKNKIQYNKYQGAYRIPTAPLLREQGIDPDRILYSNDDSDS